MIIGKLRSTSLQCHRANANADKSPSDYFKVNLYFPFIDHVIQELDTRFLNEHTELIAAENLIPLNLPNLNYID